MTRNRRKMTVGADYKFPPLLFFAFEPVPMRKRVIYHTAEASPSALSWRYLCQKLIIHEKRSVDGVLISRRIRLAMEF